MPSTYTEPLAWRPGKTPASAELNTHLRDTVDYLHNGRPFCVVRRNGNQTITTGVVTSVSWNQEIEDTDTMHDNATNPERITFTTAGLYWIWTTIRWAGSATGYRSARITYVDSSENESKAWDDFDTGAAVVPASSHAVAFVNATAGGYCVIWIQHDHGSNLDVVSHDTHAGAYLLAQPIPTPQT